jgi:hypothetical protein
MSIDITGPARVSGDQHYESEARDVTTYRARRAPSRLTTAHDGDQIVVTDLATGRTGIGPTYLDALNALRAS